MGEPAGDTDYERVGAGYAVQRRTDPRIASLVHAALGSATTVVNVGAGAGSYEPADRRVVAVEPSATMRAQRPPGSAPVVAGYAERLPLADRAVDAAMATVTVHQWSDPAAGLAELRRVARGPAVVLTFDPDALDGFWLATYSPELIAAERQRYPTMAQLATWLGGEVTVETVPIPADCVDGFTEAFYARPERMLDPAVRRAQSAWTFVAPTDEERAMTMLAEDLADGTWEMQWGELRSQPVYAGSLRLVVSRPS